MSKGEKETDGSRIGYAAADNIRRKLSGDYKVGYGKPPRNTRFKKGVSGNPTGRPKRKSSIKKEPMSAPMTSGAKAVRDELTRLVPVQDAGASKTMVMPQAAIRQLAHLAFKEKSVMATKELVRLGLQEIEREQEEIAENHRFWRRYCERFEAAAARAERKGFPLPDWWPRPEDISFPPNRPVVIHGPISAEELEIYEVLAKHRDAMIAKAKYDMVVLKFPRAAEQSPHELPAYMLLPYLLDRLQPARTRLSEDGIYERMSEALWTTRRELERELVQACASLDLKAPLNEPGPPIGHAIYKLGVDFNVIEKLCAQ